jgi:hypothetical protein
VRVENITECPPDVEDVCEGTGIPLGEAEEACTRHNNTDNFDWCVFDYCATNGDPEVPEYWHPPGNVTEPLETAPPQSAAPSADSTESAAGSTAGHLDAQEAEEPLTIKAPEPEAPTSLPSSSDAESKESKDAEARSPDAAHSPPDEGKSPAAAGLGSTVHHSTAHQSTVRHHSTVHHSTASDADLASSAPPSNSTASDADLASSAPPSNSTASDADLASSAPHDQNSTASDADLPSSPSTELPSTPPSVSDAESKEEDEQADAQADEQADEQASQHFSLSTESKDQEHSPKFMVNGKNRHFWVPTGTPTTLLEWTAHEGGRTFVLRGETFGEGASEWFRRYMLLTNGTEVLQVSIATEHLATLLSSGNHAADSDASTPKHPLRTLGVWVDGAAMKTTGKEVRSTLKGVSALASSRKWGMIGSTHAEEVEIHAPGMHLTIGSQGAKVYESETERARWAHLDIQIRGKLPKNSSGFVAELSGLHPLSDRSKALLSVPKEVYRGVQKEAKRRRSLKSAKLAALQFSSR